MHHWLEESFARFWFPLCIRLPFVNRPQPYSFRFCSLDW
jgi:hypothetical protein